MYYLKCSRLVAEPGRFVFNIFHRRRLQLLRSPPVKTAENDIPPSAERFVDPPRSDLTFLSFFPSLFFHTLTIIFMWMCARRKREKVGIGDARERSFKSFSLLSRIATPTMFFVSCDTELLPHDIKGKHEHSDERNESFRNFAMPLFN